LLTKVEGGGSQDYYIVDGQQRLTTFLLIYLALYRYFKKEHSGEEKILDELERRIWCKNDNEKHFRIEHDIPNEDIHERTLRQILNGEADNDPRRENLLMEAKRTTSKHLIENYTHIRDYLDREKDLVANPSSLEIFFEWIRKKVELIEVIVNNRRDVAMVFEAINNRGLDLETHEVFQGKLMTIIYNEEDIYGTKGFMSSAKPKTSYLKIWKNAVESFKRRKKNVNKTSSDKPDQVIPHLFKGIYGTGGPDTLDMRFGEKNYHKEVMVDPKEVMVDPNEKVKLGIKETAESVKEFLQKDLQFYGRLHRDLYEEHEYSRSDGNKVAWVLFCAAISSRVHDVKRFEEEKEEIRRKAKILSFEFRRIQSLLNTQKESLTGSVEDNLKRIIYPVAQAIRNETRDKKNEEFWNDPEKIREVFDKEFSRRIESKKDKRITPSEVFSIDRFSINQDQKFLQQVESFLRHAFKETQERKRKDKEAKGIDLEHIWANDPDNINREELKDDADKPETRDFKEVRDDIGARVLLLQNTNRRKAFKVALYKDKVKEYRNSNFIWTQMLNPHFAKERKDLIEKLREEHKFDDEDFRPVEEKFTCKDKKQREKTLAKIVKIIWAENTLDKNGDPKVQFDWWK
ncbi:MAG: DUF262 domain-containing protein, partial [Cytophagales bacterium]|nr:DUF262 domain-containing protein [Cytophagales bacterium]